MAFYQLWNFFLVPNVTAEGWGRLLPLRREGKTGMRAAILFIVVILLGLDWAPWAQAETTRKDLLVMARMISFLSTRPSGVVHVAIVYAPGNAESRQDADGLLATLGSGLTVGSLTLVPLLVPVDQLQTMAGVAAVVVTAGLDSYFDAIFHTTAALKLVSLSSDFNCVRSGKCVVSVRSEPKVDIVVSRAAAELSSVAFVAAVRLMITEI